MNIYRILEIEDHEKAAVNLFLLQSFFLGLFFGSLDIISNSLFLSTYNTELLPKAFIISGLVGISMTLIFSHLQTRVKFSLLSIIYLLFIALSVVFIRFGFTGINYHLFVFLLLVLMGPLTVTGLLIFWGGVSRMFTLRQGKRLFSLIDSGQIFGIIVSSYSIPILLKFNFLQIDLLYFSVISVIIAFLIQLIIIKKYLISDKINISLGNKYTQIKPIKVVEIFKNNYLRAMALFVVVSMVCAFFVHFAFLTSLKHKYPNSTEFAQFFGFFMGTLMVFTFIVKTFVYSKLLNTYNLKTSLLLLPVLLLIFSVLSILFALLFGFSTQSSGFLLFILFIALLKLFQKSLRDSIEMPSFKVLYQSIDANYRYDIQGKLDGIINEIAALLAGVILFLIGTIKFIQLAHYIIILIILLFFYIFLIHRLYSRYQESLKLLLFQTKSNIVENIKLTGNDENRYFKNKKLALFYINLIKTLQHSEFEYHFNVVNDLKNDLKIEIFNSVIRCDTFYNLFYQPFSSQLISYDELVDLSNSNNYKSRFWAAKYISINKIENYYSLLFVLLQDNNLIVSRMAIRAVREIKSFEFYNSLFDLLSNNYLENEVIQTLVSLGEPTIQYCEQYFFKSELTKQNKIKIIKIVEKIGGEKAINFLITKLAAQQIDIELYILNALAVCNFSVGISNRQIIKQLLEKYMSVIAWNYNSIALLKSSKSNELLKRALESEITENTKIIFTILSLLYEKEMVSLVKRNLETGVTERVGYALEMLELFVDEDSKQKLFPLIETISVAEKAKRMQNFYPLENLNRNELMLQILNRNINLISRYTKICTLYNIENNLSDELILTLQSLLFSNDSIIQLISAQLLFQRDKNYLFDCISRIDKKDSYLIENKVLEIVSNKRISFFNKLKILNKFNFIKNINNECLTEIISNLNEIRINKSENILNPNKTDKYSDYLSTFSSLYFIVEGRCALISNDNESIFSENTCIGYILADCLCSDNMNITAIENCLLFELTSEKLIILCNSYPDFYSEILNLYSELNIN